MEEKLKVFSNSMALHLNGSANISTRGRSSFNLHKSFSDPSQRLFNAISMSSYIQPHRHSLDPKNETLLAIKGLFALFIFDDVGDVSQIIRFGSEKYLNDSTGMGVELHPDLWHTVVALADESILFECKPGPFDSLLAKELAPWAPKEDSAGALSYLKALRSLIHFAA